MIAKRRSLATNDFLLAVIAGAVIALHFLPPAAGRQQIFMQDARGRMQAYSVPLDAPILTRLRTKTSTEQSNMPSAAYAVAQWQAEVAGIYAEQLKPSEIQQVAYVDSPTVSSAKRSQHETWVAIQQEAESLQHQIRQLDQNALASQPEPAIQLGGRIPPRHRPFDFAMSLFGGLLTGCIFAAWAFVAPENYLPVAKTTSEVCPSSNQDRRFDFAFSIPSDWVRIRQTPSAWLRGSVHLLLIAVAAGLLVGKALGV